MKQIEENKYQGKNEPSTLKLRQELLKKEKEFHGKDDIFGMTLLTNPGYISSARNIMLTSHLRQFVNLENPDFPKVFTNYENIVGKHSTGYYNAKSNYKVIDKIPKFGQGNEHIYLMIMYDEENDKYDIVEKKIVEDLTEKFGFSYNNDVMDSKNVGDNIIKGERLYKSRSYDEDNNYCYGRQAKFAYMLHNNTIEDAIICSKTFADTTVSKEVETFKVSINDNDILCNIYGDNNTYKPFPDIGEEIVDKLLCVKRRIHNDQLLFDLKKSNLRKINFNSDTMQFCSGGRVIDINIYCNKPIEEIEENSFNKQLLKYIKYQREFYTRLYNRCLEIRESGSKYSKLISFYFNKAKEVLDDDYKWREEDNSVFGNIMIEFQVEREKGLSVGQKITGRYGNKGVISKIVPDDEMPVLETGERIDVIFNTLGVINRLNSFQLIEQSITFICNRVVEKLRTLTTMKEKEELIFKTIGMFNIKQRDKMKKLYDDLSEYEKDEFFDDIDTRGIYINIQPMWEDEAIFDKLIKIYKEFDWIKPYDVFVKKFGRMIKILKPMIVGEMYIIKLKQTSEKGFSARSAGNLSQKGIPEKSNKTKDLYSKTPVRVGIDENLNSLIGVNGESSAKMHLAYRTSVVGRRDLGEALIKNIKGVKDFRFSHDFKNRNVEILNAYLKCIGLRINFDDNYKVDIYTDKIEEHSTDDKIYISTKEQFEDIKLQKEVEKHYSNDELFIGSVDEFEKAKDREFKLRKLEKDNMVIRINM